MNEREAPARIEALVNGDRRALDAGTRIVDLVDPALGRGVAVARNGEVVARGDWETVRVEPGDEIEIVRPIQGG